MTQADWNRGLTPPVIPQVEHTKPTTKMTLAVLVSVLSDRYEIRETVRDTFSARVLRALRNGNGSDVRLTVVPPACEEQQRGTSIHDVIRELRNVRCDYIVPISDCYVLPDGSTLLETPWVDGESLMDRINTSPGGLAESVVLPWMKQVSEAMTFVAELGIVHRNLKPASILLDDRGRAIVDNWSCATFTGIRRGVAGTRPYMSPEQFEQTGALDSRSDIYGFAATFHHALLGEPPERHEAGWQRPSRDASAATDASTVVLTPTLFETLKACLATNPRDRVQSFVEIRTQLDSLQRPIRLRTPIPRIHGYHIVSALGEGGMGAVFKARRNQSDRFVAVKVMRALGEQNPELLARFRIEAEAVACLRHENIVPIVEIGAADGMPYFVLEYVSGGNLKDLIMDQRPPPEDSARLVAGIARGLSHAHRLGILHRDLKPQNVVRDQSGIPKITDFGLARFMMSGASRERLRRESILPGIQHSLLAFDDIEVQKFSADEIEKCCERVLNELDEECLRTVQQDTLTDFVSKALGHACRLERMPAVNPTQRGDILGTPSYMAPEQTLGDPDLLGPHTDIYAAGVVFYELLTGRLPFCGSSVSQLFDAIRNQQPEPLGRRVSEELGSICMKCLSKEPEDRFGSAVELADALDRFVSGNRVRRTRWRFWR